MFRRAYCWIVLFLFVSSFARSAEDHSRRAPTLTPQTSGTSQGLIAVSPVTSRIVWASGRGGTFVVTTDGGKNWRSGVVPGAEALQFRDVQGITDKIAYLMSIGDNPGDFRIYKTINGGATWSLQFQNALVGAFYDCFAFWSPWRGIAHSDAVEQTFPDLRTRDGKNWRSIRNNMPPALPGEASFSSSGTCVATQGFFNAWIATGGSSTARILATRDGGFTWNAYDTPLVSSPSAGAFTVSFRDLRHGIVGGGDLDPANPNAAATAVSDDGGRTWELTNKPPVTGAIFGLSYATSAGSFAWPDGDSFPFWRHDHDQTVVITANDGGAAWTPNEGRTWYPLTGVTGYWGVAFSNPRAGWLVGTEGRILKISF
jgi:photosystem II stability/assembly factor-like uncharacterized protein